jgi:lysophospholipase L1-like esterase
MRIFIFGDSITQGFYSSFGGWAQLIINDVHIKNSANLPDGSLVDEVYNEIYNLGISGDTVDGILNRMSSEISARHLYQDKDVIVLAVGVNDAALAKNRVFKDEKDFEIEYEELVEEALTLTKNVICVGLSPVDEALTDPWKFSSTGKQWKNNRIDLFEDIIKQITVRNKVSFIGIFDSFMQELKAGSNLHSDGLHPNDGGHKLIADAVRPVIQELVA